jgi:mRNA interferase MazF
MAANPSPSRGEIWLIQFDPSVGAEIRKVRPAVVLSLDGIGRLPLKVVAPITAWSPDFGKLPWFVFLRATADNGLAKDSVADAFQVKSISLARFVRKLGVTTDLEVEEIAAAVSLCIGLP